MQLDLAFREELRRHAGADSPSTGPTLVTTIDAGIQRAVHEAIDRGAAEGGFPDTSAIRGAAVVLDATTGEILALESRPSFSLAELTDPELWAAAEATDRRDGFRFRYLNRAVHGYYAPGSTFKVVTAAAALQAGLHEGGSRDFDYRRGPKSARPPDGLSHLGRWHQLPLTPGPAVTDGNHSHVKEWNFNLEEALAWSCNIAFAEMGLELGPERLVATARGFGFERRIDVPGLGGSLSTVDNDRGDVPSARFLGKSPGNLARTAFGQGQIRATPLQMALVPAAIASGGKVMQPQIVRGWRSSGRWLERTSPRVLADTRLRRDVIRDLRAMMQATATYGWARGAKLNRDNRRPGVAGKTGSAEWSASRNARTHGWFVGYFPAESPRLALAVIVERGGLGSTVATPIARRIFASPAVRRYLEGTGSL